MRRNAVDSLFPSRWACWTGPCSFERDKQALYRDENASISIANEFNMQASGASFFEIMQSAPRHGHSESPYLRFLSLFRGGRIREGKAMPNHTHTPHPSHARLRICNWISKISSLLSRILWGTCMHACRAQRRKFTHVGPASPDFARECWVLTSE